MSAYKEKANTHGLRARLACLASLLQQLNAQNACDAVNDAIDAIQSPVCRDWVAWLESQSDDDLREIFAFRPDLSERLQAVITANAVPSGVYFSEENCNFYSATTMQGMGGAFFQRWFTRRADFTTFHTPRPTQERSDEG